MRRMYRLPPLEAMQEHKELSTDDPDAPSFFQETTIRPLYNMLKAVNKKDEDASRLERDLGKVIWCFMKRGRKRAVKNSARPNYDDMNELFWSPHVVNVTYHSLDREHGLHNLGRVRKTFREKSSYAAVFLSFWR